MATITAEKACLRREEVLARLCMLVMGVGYLFPISAIWAAFDYWTLLFPGTNIEFVVTGVYQLGSVVTVAVLSVTPALVLGPRILGGFAGQFACLAVILALRWVTLPANLLLDPLLMLVLFCAIATGYLDSALYSLCSQYDPEMQRFLQIGLGFSTFVSVMYRDTTKVMMSGDIADATSIYFAASLVTVLICIASYKTLMSLPLSQSVCMADEKLRRLKEPLCPPQSPSQVSPLPTTCEAESTDAKADASFGAVWGSVWRNELVIFCNLLLTTLCYPGLLTSIPCRQFTALRGEQWFQTLLLTAFTVADIMGRFMTHYRAGLDHKNIWLTVVVRAVIFPLMMYCILSSAAHDLMSFAVVCMFGFLNGYCVSMALIVPNEIPGLSSEQRSTCGRITVAALRRSGRGGKTTNDLSY